MRFKGFFKACRHVFSHLAHLQIRVFCDRAHRRIGQRIRTRCWDRSRNHNNSIFLCKKGYEYIFPDPSFYSLLKIPQSQAILRLRHFITHDYTKRLLYQHIYLCQAYRCQALCDSSLQRPTRSRCNICNKLCAADLYCASAF